MKAWIATLALGAAVGVATAACRASSTEDPARVTVPGVIEAREIELRAELAGQVVAVTCDEGDRVAPGQALVALDDAEQRAALLAAEAALAEAQAQLALLEAGSRAEDRDTARARVALEVAREADAAAEVARLERQAGLGLTASEQLERAQARLGTARAARGVAEAERARVEAPARAEELAVARAALGSPRAQVERARLDLDRTRVSAPASGAVVLRAVEPGEVVSPGALLLRLRDLDRLEVRIYLREPLLGRVRPGTVVEVRCDAWPGRTFPGRVIRLADEAEFTPRSLVTPDERVKLVYAATVRLDPAGQDLLPGMPVDVCLRLDAPEAP